MNKKEYIQPTMMVAEMETECILLVSGGYDTNSSLQVLDGEDGEEME